MGIASAKGRIDGDKWEEGTTIMDKRKALVIFKVIWIWKQNDSGGHLAMRSCSNVIC